MDHSILHPQPTTDVSDTALAGRCRMAGLKATAQRIAVLRSLASTESHPSPEATFIDVQRQLPTISRGTVYKTLEALEAVGLVQQVALRFETKRYDGNLTPHHHLVCTVCNGVTDINHPALDGLRPPTIDGFSASSLRVQVLGVCEDCATARGSPDATKKKRTKTQKMDDASSPTGQKRASD